MFIVTYCTYVDKQAHRPGLSRYLGVNLGYPKLFANIEESFFHL